MCACISWIYMSDLTNKIIFTYPMSGLAPGRSAPFVHVSVTELSVVFTIFGVPGGDRNVLGSGVRCKTGELLFST